MTKCSNKHCLSEPTCSYPFGFAISLNHHNPVNLLQVCSFGPLRRWLQHRSGVRHDFAPYLRLSGGMDEFEELRLKVRSTPRFRSKDVEPSRRELLGVVFFVESDVPKSICLSKYGFERTAQLQECTAALIGRGGSPTTASLAQRVLVVLCPCRSKAAM